MYDLQMERKANGQRGKEVQRLLLGPANQAWAPPGKAGLGSKL